MRVTDSSVDTQIAQLAEEGDGLITEIVGFFDVEQASPSTPDPRHALSKRSRDRIARRAGSDRW